MIARSILCVCICVFATQAFAGDDPLDALKAGQPKDVINLLDRIVGCNHWAGEEPYDAERRKEIAAAVADLKCDRLAKDKAAVLKRYAMQPRTIKVLKQAEEMYY